MDYRVIFSDNGTLTDYTLAMKNYYSETATFNFVAAEDYIYFGSMYPFNGLYFLVSTTNATPVVASFDVWDGNQWRTAVETLDDTNSFGQSGYMTYVPNRKYNWHREDTVDENGNARIEELKNVTIYDLYWSRLSLNTDITFALQYVGHQFSDDNDLYTEHPMLNNSVILDDIESGKTDWDEQSARASNLLIDDMISRGIIDSSSQILDRFKLNSVNVSKTAELIYTMMGDDYIDQRQQAQNQYNKRLNKKIFNVDINDNARLDIREASFRHGGLFK